MREMQRAPSAAAEIASARQRVVTALEGLDVDFSASLWRPSAEEAIHTLTSIRIDWELFFRRRTFAANAHPSLAPTYKWLAACWLTGCGGEVRSYTMATVRGRLYAVRQVLDSLQADADSLATFTPRQIQRAVCAVHDVGAGVAQGTAQSMRLTLEAVHDLYRLRHFLPSAPGV